MLSPGAAPVGLADYRPDQTELSPSHVVEEVNNEMSAVIDRLASDCRQILEHDASASGLEQVRARLEEVLVDQSVIDDYFGPSADSPRRILYEDPDLGFCIIAHVFEGPRVRDPHDHGPTWAIYGQVEGTTNMTEFRVVQKPTARKPGNVEATKTYDLEPGMAVAYDIGVLHAPVRDATTKLLRIEGRNMKGVERDAYEAIASATG